MKNWELKKTVNELKESLEKEFKIREQAVEDMRKWKEMLK